MPDHVTVSMEMPRYKCHKTVHALKIGEVRHAPNGVIDFVPVDGRYAPIEITREWFDKHAPAPGGYYVVYDDGYKSYSPAKAFEEGYVRE